MEHIRDHIQRIRSRNLSFCRELGHRTEFVEMRNRREVKYRLRLRPRAEDWVTKMEWSRGVPLCAKHCGKDAALLAHLIFTRP